MLISRFLIGKAGRNPVKDLAIVYAAMAACAFALIKISASALSLTVIGLVSCLSCAANTVLLSLRFKPGHGTRRVFRGPDDLGLLRGPGRGAHLPHRMPHGAAQPPKPFGLKRAKRHIISRNPCKGK